jgi:hypothetical protein
VDVSPTDNQAAEQAIEPAPLEEQEKVIKTALEVPAMPIEQVSSSSGEYKK